LAVTTRAAKAAHEILAEHARTRARDARGLSLRAAARGLGISPSFLSEVLRGKKPIPPRRLGDFARFFGLDEAAERCLRKDVARQKMTQGLARHGLEASPGPLPEPHALAPSPIDDYEDKGKATLALLEHWRYLAILDLATCADFSDDPAWMAARLGLGEAECAQALARLLALGFLRQEADGAYEKQTRLLRFAPRRSDPRVRALHAQMMQKALAELRLESSDEAFERRMISGITVAVNPRHFAQARTLLNETLHRVAEMLTEGECTEVYQLNCQLFPLTKKWPRHRHAKREAAAKASLRENPRAKPD
jgi:transcriptional regulator with XRE-family HTH domain